MAHHGKEGQVKTGSNTTSNVTGFTLETSGDVVEDTALGSGVKTFVAGRTSFSGTIDCNWDEGDTSQEEMDCGSSLTFGLYPEGTTSGDTYFSGSGIVTGMSIGVTLDGVTSRTVTFQGTGALTQSTV